jgi:polyisoprenoid-binding protein YceI
MSERWEIDPGHSRLGFSAKHLMVTTVRGQFTDIDGYVEVPDGGEGGQVVVNARAASITTH